jgi:MoaA/NifB/PqqE/SkfB family radical SAM enzyme
MSQYVLHGIDEVEVEIDMADYEFQVKYEKAFEEMIKEEKALQKVGKNSEITKGYCEMFNHLFDNILGEGISEKLFAGKYNTLTTNRVYGELLEICSAQVKSNNAERDKIINKYRPNRAQRRAKK